MSHLLLTFLLLAALASQAGAQVTALRTGDEVRVKSDWATGRFIVHDASADPLVLRHTDGHTVSVPLAWISSLSVARGQFPRGMGGLRGGGIGLASGVAFGIIAGFVSGDDPDQAYGGLSGQEKAVRGAMLFGGTGAVVGALVGLAAPGKRWEQVRLPDDVRAGASRDGGFALGYAIRF